jgi:O-antigen/teichoic acid export membrane protein
MSLKKNVIANFFGGIWVSLISLIFIPLYIRFLGIESYGLIGFFGVLLTVLALLDVGMTPTINREMARYTAGEHTPLSIRSLLKSILIVALGMAMVISLGVYLGAGWLAENWLQAGELPTGTAADAIAIMGFIIAMRFVEGVLKGAIAGLQKQVLLNIINAVIETTRAVGALFVIVYVSSNVSVFFYWQGVVSLTTLIVLVGVIGKLIPKPEAPAEFSLAALKKVRRFASGVFGISILAMFLTQLDKMILSRYLPLAEFGYYTFAFVAANAIHRLSGPVTQAIFPHFSALEAKGNPQHLIETYHRSAQVMALLIIPVSMIICIHSGAILQLWTQDPELTRESSGLLSIIVTGVMLNALLQLPGLIQLAHSWTGLILRTNICALLFLAPLMFWSVPRYGAIAAAWLWVLLNVGYFFIQVPLIHKRILKGELGRWYFHDNLLPLIAVVVALYLCSLLWPINASEPAWLIVVKLAFNVILALSAALATLPLVRGTLGNLVQGHTRFKLL